MTQLPSDKFNVAWFKLAEFVVRREKERALYIYRLLVHSLPSEALAAQLEGDLLLSFNDDKSFDCYIKAAQLYEREEQYIQAIAIYEHLIMLAPHLLEPYAKLAYLYDKTGNHIKATQYTSYLTKAPTDYKQASV